MGYGYLYYTTVAAEESLPEGFVTVTITDEAGRLFSTAKTDSCGEASPVALPAPDAEFSQEITNTQVRPYAVYNLKAEKTGFYTVEKNNIEIFDTQVAMPEIKMIPIVSGTESLPQSFTFPTNHLWDPASPNVRTGTPPPVGDVGIQGQVFIPNKIRVKLGTPSSGASIVSVNFTDYIKRVASSEIYPTWPVQALRANILAQISLALNRVFTEWYPSKGYNFDITNSTSYDQAYTHGREVYSSIAIQVDDIFNNYILHGTGIEPYYAEYCDGKSVSCPGMKQWGSKTLADQGYSALQILRNYYGSTTRIASTNLIQNVTSSYPGTPLRKGNNGDNVRIIQLQLNRIAKNYPGIGKINPIDGNFGTTTENVVKAFQKQFKLTPDGVVGKSTWYKISYIYASVKKLAELTSEGEEGIGTANLPEGSYPGTALRQGSTGNSVREMQMFLAVIAPYYPSINVVTVDGNFGSATQEAVRAFQTQFHLTVDGVVGEETWNAMFNEYEKIQKDTLQPGVASGTYPGTALRQGDRGVSVQLAQFYLAVVASSTTGIPVIEADGAYGSATANAVRAFQNKYGLAADGVIGQNTWSKLYTLFLSVLNGIQGSGVYPGTALRQGSSGASVKEMQFYLYVLSYYYPTIPTIAYDGSFGSATTSAVRAFQTLAGLSVDGVVGANTWNALYATYLQARTTKGTITPVYNVQYPLNGQLSEGEGTGPQKSDVAMLQTALSVIGNFYDSVPAPEVTNMLNAATVAAVRAFQQEFQMPVTGIADEETWNAIIKVWLGLRQKEAPLWQEITGTIVPVGEDEPEGAAALNTAAAGYANVVGQQQHFSREG